MQFSLFIYSFIFISGLASIIYEIVWTRQLTLLFGVSIYAVSAVLAAFMLGLAAGSYFFGKWIDRWQNPLRIYSLLEFGTGAYALLFPFLLKLSQSFYLAFAHVSQRHFFLLLVRFFFTLILLFAPTMLMGATLPVVSKLFSNRFHQFGRSIAALYGFNTLGAMSGAFLTGFLFLQYLGVRGSTFIAFGGNLLLGLSALLLSSRFTLQNRIQSNLKKNSGASQPAHIPRHEHEPISRATRKKLLIATAISGFCALGYEILWTRLLILILGNSTWAFSTALVTFLASIALGSLVVIPYLDQKLNRLHYFANSQLLIALFAAASLFAFRWITAQNFARAGSTLIGVMAIQFLLSTLVMAPAAFLSGLAFPLATKLYVHRVEQSGKAFGGILAANTLGAVLGSAAVGLPLLFYLGIQNSLLLLAILNAAAGIWLLGDASAKTRRLQNPVALAGMALMILLFTLLVLPRAPLTASIKGYRQIYYRESPIGTLSVYQSKTQQLKVFNINNITEVATDSTSLNTFRLMAFLPVLLHPRPEDILVVTFGAGLVTGYLAPLTPETLDCVEINPQAREIGRIFSAENGHVVDRTNVNLAIEDGRNFLFTRQKQYDIITADATHPTGADSWLLYTKEYYQLCQRHLKAKGIFLQWLPLHALTPQNYQTIVATSGEVFKNVSIWFAGIQDGIGHTLLIASNEPLILNYQDFKKRLKSLGTQNELQKVGLNNPAAILALFMADKKSLASYLRAAKINTDDLAPTAFPTELPRPTLARENLAALLPYRHPPAITHFTSRMDSETFSQAFTTGTLLLQAYLQTMQNNFSGAVSALNDLKTIPRENAWQTGPIYLQMEEEIKRRLFLAAKEALRQNQNDRTILYLNAVIQLGPTEPEIYFMLANLQQEKGLPQAALRTLRKAARFRPSGETYFRLGTLALQAGRLHEALGAYKKTVQYEPDLGIAFTNMGMIYARLENWPGARWAWQRAVKLNPADSLAARNLRRLNQLYPAQKPIRH